MKRNYLLWCLVVVAVGLWLFSRGRMPAPEPNVIEYQGQRFKLTRAYADYDDYKQDPDNLDPSENARVEQAVTEAKVASSYPSLQQAVLAVFALQFPGYGLTSFGDKPQADGSTLAGFAVEVPRADKYRILVFRGRGGRYSLIDDFISGAEPRVMQVREEGGQLVYGTLDGKPLLARSLAAK